jgi:hypothetical protein
LADEAANDGNGGSGCSITHWRPTAATAPQVRYAQFDTRNPRTPQSAVMTAGVCGLDWRLGSAPTMVCSDYAQLESSGAVLSAQQTRFGWGARPARPAATSGTLCLPQGAAAAAGAEGHLQPNAAAMVTRWPQRDAAGWAGQAGSLCGERDASAFPSSARPLALLPVADAAALAGSAHFVAPFLAWPPSFLTGGGGGGAAGWQPSHSQLAYAAAVLQQHARLTAAQPLGREAGAADSGFWQPWMSQAGGHGHGSDSWHMPWLQ